jgi:predicted ribosomally synthesized peptide with nif11-like leader
MEGLTMDEMHIKEVFSNEAFVKSIMELETPEEVQEALQKEGIDLSVDEIVTIMKLAEKKIANGGELSEEELESVTGGVIWAIVIIFAIVGVGFATATTGAAVSSARRRW